MSARAFLAASLLGLPALARAQYPSLRSADTRTATPENVMGARKEWGADLSYGGSFNRGNVDTNFISSGFDLFKAFGQDTGYLNGSLIYNTFNHVRVLNQGSVTARYDHPVSGPWKVFVFNTNAYNEFIQLDYRETVGAGPWYDLALGPTKHGLSLALYQEHERFKGGVYQDNVRVSFRDVSLFPISDVASLRTDFFYAPRVDRFADNHIFFQADFESLFYKKLLGLKLSFIDEYDSRPRPRIKRNDTIWLTSLAVHLGK
ncbi:MAG TPA: DUF481 domain-containing protein [Elusimicrobiota bacterium]|jgi:hypothetical protein|nr:DUF481 domain-containing protein [Elusimicrobiota bacterium]